MKAIVRDASGWAPGDPNEPIVILTVKCNQRCVFCSRGSKIIEYSPVRIREVIKEHKEAICFEGGEPTLVPAAFDWIRCARRAGVRDIVLVTNGYGLDDPAFAQKFLDAGVTLFNVNIPAHTEDAFDAITQTRGNFQKRVQAVKTLIKLAGPRRVRITFVVNALTLKSMPAYVDFLLREFPGLFYLEINAIKMLGHTADRRWLAPTLTEAEPYLLKAFAALTAGGLGFLTDGFPLCFMKGYEHRSVDAQNLARGRRRFSMGEKANCPPCGRCSLLSLCPGPRKDYVALHGWKELRPSRLRPSVLKARFERPRRRPAGKRPARPA